MVFINFGNDIQTTTSTIQPTPFIVRPEVQLIEKNDELESDGSSGGITTTTTIETTKIQFTTPIVNDVEVETMTSTMVVTEPPTTPEPRKFYP